MKGQELVLQVLEWVLQAQEWALRVLERVPQAHYRELQAQGQGSAGAWPKWGVER